MDKQKDCSASVLTGLFGILHQNALSTKLKSLIALTKLLLYSTELMENLRELAWTRLKITHQSTKRKLLQN